MKVEKINHYSEAYLSKCSGFGSYVFEIAVSFFLALILSCAPSSKGTANSSKPETDYNMPAQTQTTALTKEASTAGQITKEQYEHIKIKLREKGIIINEELSEFVLGSKQIALFSPEKHVDSAYIMQMERFIAIKSSLEINSVGLEGIVGDIDAPRIQLFSENLEAHEARVKKAADEVKPVLEKIIEQLQLNMRDKEMLTLIFSYISKLYLDYNYGSQSNINSIDRRGFIKAFSVAKAETAVFGLEDQRTYDASIALIQMQYSGAVYNEMNTIKRMLKNSEITRKKSIPEGLIEQIELIQQNMEKYGKEASAFLSEVTRNKAERTYGALVIAARSSIWSRNCVGKGRIVYVVGGGDHAEPYFNFNRENRISTITLSRIE